MINLMESSPSLPLCLLLLLFAYWFPTISHAQPRYDYCQSKCGKHSIDYPFGIADQPDCYLQGFQVRCINDTVLVLAADASNLTVEEFMMAQGKVVLRWASLMAFECVNQTAAEANPRVCLNLPVPFTISARSNRFMALGCHRQPLLHQQLPHPLGRRRPRPLPVRHTRGRPRLLLQRRYSQRLPELLAVSYEVQLGDAGEGASAGGAPERDVTEGADEAGEEGDGDPPLRGGLGGGEGRRQPLRAQPLRAQHPVQCVGEEHRLPLPM